MNHSIARPDRASLFPLAFVFICIMLTGGIYMLLQRPLAKADIDPVQLNHRININTADAATLSLLPGIGPGLGQAIVTHREEHGPFNTTNDLQNVKGIGPVKLQSVESYVKCE